MSVSAKQIKLSTPLAKTVMVILLLFAILLLYLSWYNKQDNDPLPVPTTPIYTSAQAVLPVQTPALIQVCATTGIQQPLNKVIQRFKRHYSTLNVHVTYIDNDNLNDLAGSITNDCQQQAPSDTTAQLDMILAKQQVTDNSLLQLQQTLSHNRHNDDQQISTFAYTKNPDGLLTGILLNADEPVLQFRNFLISSMGQDLFVEYGYLNIDDYNNQVNDLFNPNPSSNKDNQNSDDPKDSETVIQTDTH